MLLTSIETVSAQDAYRREQLTATYAQGAIRRHARRHRLQRARTAATARRLRAA